MHETNHEPVKGLPPVAPPSGKHIVQLFVVPAVIVAVALGILWIFDRMFGGSRTPEQFLKDLSSPNAELRWRAASDLAQVLPRDKELASDPRFSLDLALLLQNYLHDRDQNSTSPIASRPNFNPENWHELPDQEKYILYLINCLGDCTLPVGLPLLKEIAVKGDGADSALVLLRRRNALLAIIKLGEGLNHFDRQWDALPESRRQEIQATLSGEAANSGPQRDWAQFALDFLNNRTSKGPQALGVDQVLARCADADDPLLRKYVALALAFWYGSPQENALMDKTLDKLCYDTGKGADQGQTKQLGLEIRYKAAEVLARRGSDMATRRFNLLKEMLDEAEQERNFRTKLSDGRDVPEETYIVSTVRGALGGLIELHAKKPGLDLSPFHDAIRKLTQSSRGEIKTEALRAKTVLGIP